MKIKIKVENETSVIQKRKRDKKYGKSERERVILSFQYDIFF